MSFWSISFLQAFPLFTPPCQFHCPPRQFYCQFQFPLISGGCEATAAPPSLLTLSCPHKVPSSRSQGPAPLLSPPFLPEASPNFPTLPGGRAPHIKRTKLPSLCNSLQLQSPLFPDFHCRLLRGFACTCPLWLQSRSVPLQRRFGDLLHLVSGLRRLPGTPAAVRNQRTPATVLRISSI